MDVLTHHFKTLTKFSDQAKGIIGEGPLVATSRKRLNWYTTAEVDTATNPEFEHHVAWNHGPDVYVDEHANRKWMRRLNNSSTLPPTSPIRVFFSRKMERLKAIPRPANLPIENIQVGDRTATVEIAEAPPVVEVVEDQMAAEVVEDPLAISNIAGDKRSRDWFCNEKGCAKKLKLKTTGEMTIPILNHIKGHSENHSEANTNV